MIKKCMDKFIPSKSWNFSKPKFHRLQFEDVLLVADVNAVCMTSKKYHFQTILENLF